MSAIVIWRPEPLNARLLSAARSAAADFTGLARAHAPAKAIASSIFMSGTTTNFNVGSASPLGTFFEEGVKPHEIEPKKQVLRLADGGFVSGPVQHPGMAAQPFLKPLLPLWGSLYRRRAAGAFRGI